MRLVVFGRPVSVRRLRRSPLVFWTAALVVAGLAGTATTRAVAEAEARARELGGLVEVAVAARPLHPGDEVRGGDVTVERLPAALLPDSSPVPAGAVAGRIVVVPVVPGEVLTEAKVGGDGVTGAAALVPAGMRAIAVPVGAGIPPLEQGHRVDVLATFETAFGPDGEGTTFEMAFGPDSGGATTEPIEPTFAVAEDAVVVAVDDDVVTVAVPAADAPRVAYAVATAIVTLALSGTPR